MENMMPMGPGSDTNSSSSMGKMMMHMTFYWGKHVLVLFPGWPKDNIGMYLLSLLFVFVLAAGVEVLSVPPAAARLVGSNPTAVALVEAVVYGVKMGLAYMVMLSVMSYNLGVFIAAVLGHFVAKFFIRVRALSAAAAANPPESETKV